MKNKKTTASECEPSILWVDHEGRNSVVSQVNLWTSLDMIQGVSITADKKLCISSKGVVHLVKFVRLWRGVVLREIENAVWVA